MMPVCRPPAVPEVPFARPVVGLSPVVALSPVGDVPNPPDNVPGAPVLAVPPSPAEAPADVPPVIEVCAKAGAAVPSANRAIAGKIILFMGASSTDRDANPTHRPIAGSATAR